MNNSKHKFKRFSDFGPLDINNYESFMEMSKEQFNSTWLKNQVYEETLSDFEFIELLGQGTFGKVVLVNNKLSQRHRYHAMKIIEKRKVVEKKQIENTKTEKNVMQSLTHPLMIHLDYFFQDNSYLYFIMPHIPGGELFSHLRKLGRFEEVHCQFYSAQVILALEFLHYINFIHRDLKPENILIDHMGYLKLSDFGFCKRLDKGRTYTLCGTPEYMAPELIMHKGYGFAADWWAVGILIYELSAGRSPFYSKNMTKMFNNVTTNLYKMPLFFSVELRDIINNLLQVDISKRFGNLKDGVDDIKQHKWFWSTNWLALLSRKVHAPYKPGVKKPGKSGSSTKLKLVVASEDKYENIFSGF